jgi:hypothetical protein
MLIRKGVLLSLIISMLCGVSNGAAGDVYELSCNGRLTSMVDAPEYTVIRRLTLSGRTLSMTIEYGIRTYALRGHPATLAGAPGVGLRLDKEPVVMIRSLVHGTQSLLNLVFYDLSKGKHRVTIGIVDPSMGLTQANAFCFSVPGQFSRSGHLYL